MDPGSDGKPDQLQRVLALTPVGRHELSAPQSGLSLPQRWLLSQLDGESSLADLAGRPGSPSAERFPRDAAKLVGLGLALDIGEAGPGASAFGPSTLYGDITLSLPLDEVPPAPAAPPPPQPGPGAAGRRVPALVAGAALLAVGVSAAVMGGRALDPDGGNAGRQPASAPALAKGSAAGAVVTEPAAMPVVASEGAAALAPASAALSAALSAATGAASGSTLAATAAPVLPPVPAPAPAPGPQPTTEVRPLALASRVALTDAPPRAAGVDATGRPRARTEPVAATAGGVPPAPTNAASPVVIAAPSPLVAGGPAPAPPPAVQAAAITPAPTPAPALSPTTAAPPPSPAAAGPTPNAPTVSGPATVAVAPAAAPAVAPTVAPSSAPSTPLRPLAVVEPAFPREALGLGGQAVLLQARLTVAPNGTVSQVNFAQAGAGNRVFERAARAALLQWRFPEGAGERVVVQQIRFKED